MKAEQIVHPFKLLAMLALVFFIAACSGGSTTETPLEPPVTQVGDEEETLFIGLTDAEGDFLEYQTDVVSIKLVRENGVVVETLPFTTTVDFAQYTELTEFFTAASVPTGVYVSASIVLNYTNALVQIEDALGDAVAANVVDDSGQAVTQVELEVQFGDSERFRIVPGVPAHITLDFDLENSHVVDLTTSPATAQLNGVLLADTLLETPKERRARGLLAGVDLAAGQFELHLRPFYRATGLFGSISVLVDGSTDWEINGLQYDGIAGLEALALLPDNSHVVTFGALDIAARTYVASTVYAGTSVPYGDKDIVTGTVIARSGDTLRLKGAAIINRDLSIRRVSRLTVELGEMTTVTQAKSAFAAYSAADISVGQRVTVTGDLSMSTANEWFLDAINGHVRLLYSQLHGVVKEVAPLVIDLSRINRVRPLHYDFSGTGSGPDQDADPDHYEVDTGSLTLDGIDINDAVKLRGFAQAYGFAPADFLAQTLGDVSGIAGISRVRWSREAGDSALIGIDDQALVLDLSQSTRAVHWYSGAIPFDMKSSELAWTVSPAENGRGLFAIVTRDSRQVFTRFNEFSMQLLSQLNSGEVIRFVRTKDTLNADSLVSEARKIVVIIGDP